MMTQPIRTFKDLSSETAPAGGNVKVETSFEDRRTFELRARTARAQLVADGLVDALLWVGRQWRRLVEGVKADIRLRAAESELYRMSDRELADLGLSRTDIPFAVREAAHGIAPDVNGFDAALHAANQNLRRAA
jgi:uncharacterized protein YjiS (DUF1127 family)